MIECASQDVAEQLDQVKAFADQVGATSELQKALDYLGGYACSEDTETCCVLHPDFAPHSFSFVMQRRQVGEVEFRRWFCGGLIYSGPGLPAAGSDPSLTVSLDSRAASGAGHMWGVHT